jgi:hypothetical protein
MRILLGEKCVPADGRRAIIKGLVTPTCFLCVLVLMILCRTRVIILKRFTVEGFLCYFAPSAPHCTFHVVPFAVTNCSCAMKTGQPET